MPRPALSFGGFNPRTRVGCDYCMPKVTFVMALFQSTHPRGVRRALSGRGSITCRFQSTHPRGVRLHFHAISLPEGAGFNPRTRVGCDSSMAMPPAMASLFQSTHPRGVRRPWSGGCRSGRYVSIHAPAWGATQCFDFFLCCFPVSIHAPAWGATLVNPSSSMVLTCFNPRTRVGCDTFMQYPSPKGRVSIHAPAWGATGQQLPGNTSHVKFQSTHPRGVRRLPLNRPNRISRFQSTHPRGVRPCGLHDATVPGRVSIHAPAWGATLWCRSRCAGLRCFNPRTRVGCDSA